MGNGLIVGIYNEEGGKDNGLYEVISRSTARKNAIRIRNVTTGDIRLVHKDRIFSKRSRTVKKTAKKKRTKKKKPMVKFDLSGVQDMGVLFKAKEKKSMEAGGSKIAIESFCVVSDDGTKWKHFNLYEGSLGKKAKPPEFGDNDNVKYELSGDISAIQKYLEKKGYEKVG